MNSNHSVRSISSISSTFVRRTHSPPPFPCLPLFKRYLGVKTKLVESFGRAAFDVAKPMVVTLLQEFVHQDELDRLLEVK